MTDEQLLNAALHGGEADWEKLHQICADRSRAEALARMLERYAYAGMETAEAWAHVLSDLHPDLKVDLRPPPA